MAAEFNEIVALLAETKVFRNFPIPELEKIAEKVKRETHPKGAVLYRKGDPGTKLFLIAGGQVSLLGSAMNGKETAVSILGQGEIFGEMSLLTGEPRSVTVRLDATSNFLVLEKKDFDELLSANPNIGIYLSQIISQRLATTMLGRDKNQAIHPKKPKLHLFMRLAPEQRGTLFTLNLAVNLVEQTRRKVALVELCLENQSSILAVLGQPSALAEPGELSGLGLKELLKKVRLAHPSGLDILTVPSLLFASPHDREKALAALNWLRSNYDHTILLATPLQWQGLQPVLEEVDQIYLLSDSQDPASEMSRSISELLEKAGTGTTLHEIVLVADGKDSFVDPKKIRIGWSRAIDRDFEQNRSPFAALNATRTLRAIERLARILAGLKIGLALGSGGALGYSILGILKVLERERIYPDLIAGCSIGSLAGAMYAKGLSVDEIIEITSYIDARWIREFVFWDLTIPRGGGFLGGMKLQRFFRSVFDDLEFKDLEIPLACIATDIRTGEEITLTEGRITDAVRCSIAMPVIFKPHTMKGRLLVDGGLVNPVPTSTLMEMGADIRIAVRLTNSPAERRFSIGLLGKKQEEQSPGILDIFFRTILTMSHQIAASKNDESHITIHPKTPNFNWKDFDRGPELIAIGEAAGEEALPKIKSLLPFFADYCATRLKT